MKRFWNSLFGKKKAMVFVDYEYWYYSFKTLYHRKPDPSAWRQKLAEKYDIADIMVFGDFSMQGIDAELVKLRDITNTIIETGNTFQRRKKDMTDFIMLDYIYQCVAQRNDIGTYIIFTGGGHFQSVVKYLVQKKHKKVVVYGIRDSFSKQLQAAASETIQLPEENDELRMYYEMIVKNMSFVSNHPDIIPTFHGTAETVARKNRVPKKMVMKALQKMLDQGYLNQRKQKMPTGNRVKIIAPDWDKIMKDGLYKA